MNRKKEGFEVELSRKDFNFPTLILGNLLQFSTDTQFMKDDKFNIQEEDTFIIILKNYNKALNKIRIMF